MKTNQQEIAPKSNFHCTPTTCSTYKKSITPTQRITYIATLVALSLLLKLLSNMLSSVIPFFSLKISLSYLGWFVSAIILGPLGGGIVAILTDILGQLLINTGGAVIPLLVLGNFLSSFTFGLVYKLKLSNRPLVILLSATAAAIVGTLGVNTLGLWLTFYKDTSYLVFLSTRFIQLIMLYLNTVLVILLLPIIKKFKIK